MEQSREIQVLTFFSHSHLDTLLESTVLATVPGVLLDGTVPAGSAGIARVSTDTTTKETLARLAAHHTEMVSRRSIPTHFA